MNVREIVSETDDPAFDARTIRGRLLKTKDSMVTMELTDVKGHKLRLCDFDSAGENGNPYTSWLRFVNAPTVEFSRQNPTRGGRP